MESLNEYVRKQFKRKNIINIFGEPLPAEIEEKFQKDFDYDFVTEMLQSHDVNKLIDKLSEQFKDYELNFQREGKSNKEVFSILCNDKIQCNNLMNDEKFKNIISFFNYYITLVDIENCKLFLEPLYSEKMSSLEMSKCNNIFFHITKNSESARRILDSGLRCRSGNVSSETGYRYFPSKIFLIAFDDMKGFRSKLFDIAKKIGANEDSVILKIDLNRAKWINVYKDTAMGGRDDCYFTYDTIHKSFITRAYTLKELNNTKNKTDEEVL